jgi:hypothetical protein
MLNDLLNPFLIAILAVSSWLSPQPQLSIGLIGVYGNQRLVDANAEFHGYDLQPTGGCGLSSISPAHLGKLAWISFDRYNWIGPCLVVDVVARGDAYGSIYQRHEISEIRRSDLERFGLEWGGTGYMWFGACPPITTGPAQEYRPELKWDYPPYDRTPSMYPYPEQQEVIRC